MATATKNIPLSSVGQTLLGQGDMLPLQVEDRLLEEQKRRKLLGGSQVAQDLGMAPIKLGTFGIQNG